MGRPPQRPRSEYGKKLVVLREAAGLTQQQLADQLGVDQSNIAFWERWGKAPRGEVLPEMARALAVSVDELLGVTAPKRKKQAAKGRLQQVFEEVAKLPRRQQQKVIEMAEGFLALHRNSSSQAQTP
jgi:transcriptional regulator with XRE-family HTH domain